MRMDEKRERITSSRARTVALIATYACLAPDNWLRFSLRAGMTGLFMDDSAPADGLAAIGETIK